MIAVFEIYVVAYSAFYFPSARATAITMLSAGVYALALWQLDAPHWPAQWVVITGVAAAAGGVIGGLGAISRRQYEAERVTSQELRTAGEVRTAMLRAAGHDLRTPLATIAGFAELLLRHHDMDAEQRNELLDRIHHQTARVQRLLDDLLDLDRIESGHQALRTSRIAVHELVENAIAASGIDDHEIRLDVQPTVIEADRVMVERIIDNLLANASKYAPTLTTITVRVQPTRDGGQITVEDEGSGVPKALRQRLFEPFVHGEQPDAGSGIGLYLVGQFARLHGGTVTVDDRPTAGARFTVHLPHQPVVPPPD